MPVDSFRFVSPGVFINEIDQSQVSTTTTIGAGPVIFGVAEKGPALVPTRVSSFSEFVEIFGDPIPGSSANADVWRNGNYNNPTYGAYAAQAYLANGSPLTFVRPVGDQESGGTKAGWTIPRLVQGGGVQTSAGSSYGLFIVGTGSSQVTGDVARASAGEGMLAAVFHLTGSSTTIELAGPLGIDATTAPQLNAAAALIAPRAVGSNKEYRVRISGSSEILETTFNFDPKSSRYIRNVFNTNPHLLNTAITPATNQKDYFLAESFDRAVLDSVGQFSDGSAIDKADFTGTLAVLISLKSGSAGVFGGDHQEGYVTPGTPWIVSQDLTDLSSSYDVNNTVQRLFRVMSREGTEYAQSHYKISLSDIKASTNPQYQPHGTFTLLVRDIKDTDEDPRIIEQYNNLNLNPASLNYIGKRVGDRSYSYDSVNQKWKELGQYPVQSRLIRVEMDETVDNGAADSSLLPFGFRGIPTYTGCQIQSGSEQVLAFGALSGTTITSGSMTNTSLCGPGAASGSIPATAMPDVGYGLGPENQGFAVGFGTSMTASNTRQLTTASLAFPPLPMRSKASDGRLSKYTNAFFGLSTNQNATTQIFDGTIRDLVKIKATSVGTDNTILSPGFSLDDLVFSTADGATHSGSDIFMYNASIAGASDPMSPNLGNIRRGTPEGGRRAGTSMTAVSASYTEVLDRGYNRFTVPMYGGFDGFDLFEKNPFNNTRALNNGGTKTTAAYPMYYTLRKAIDSVNDVDQVNINMAAMPGVTDKDVTNYMLAMAEQRKDTLAIIDLANGYIANTEGTQSFSARVGSSVSTISEVKDRNLNSSYGAAYYPWLQINDNSKGARLWVPPSTVAMGVMASSAARSELWFAPAGFNRGGLNNGSAGLNVVNVIEKLTATQRDNLYEVNVNPIASFPAEGIVVFGQKTLQATQSALDRINVRRLMIFLKKEIRLIANNILFDPNEQVTWNRFLNQVNPFLSSIKNRFGLSDYRVILDTSTTTPDMVDRNIMYAKILLKPTRAIEFIALDFVITRSGVEFE